jgi:ankyrin repeat protein
MAAKEGDIARLKQILDNGAGNVDWKDRHGHTSLMLASMGRHIACMDYLLSNGANIDIAANGVTPLMATTVHNSPKSMELLLKWGANMELVDENHCTALARSARNKRSANMVVLLEAGAKPSYPDEELQTQPLVLAVANGDMEQVKLLLAHGANANHASRMGCSALHAASQLGQAAISRLLLEAGAVVDALDDNGNTPLMRCANNGNIGQAKLLLDAGADPDIRNKVDACVVTIAEGLRYTDFVVAMKDLMLARTMDQQVPRAGRPTFPRVRL